MNLMRKKNFLICIILLLLLPFISFNNAFINNKDNINDSLSTSQSTTIKIENVTIISDGYNDVYWNDDRSEYPSIATDSSSTVHVVWQDNTEGPWKDSIWDSEIMYAKYVEGVGWSNVTIISDNETYWNIHTSENPSIAVDNSGTVHVVWEDNTNGPWGSNTVIMYTSNDGSGWSNVKAFSGDYGSLNHPDIVVDGFGTIHIVCDGFITDFEIMYFNYTDNLGWSTPVVISDDETNWNDGGSLLPTIAADSLGTIHVAWSDNTEGDWSYDNEIWYTSNSGSGWSNATLISDDNTNWNNGYSFNPSIAVDYSNNVYIVWDDETIQPGGPDVEIMYASYIDGIGWSNATVISDDNTNWNNGYSGSPKITIDNSNRIHVVWYDTTEGFWGYDSEIMYISSDNGINWSNITIISDDETHWNNGFSEFADIIVDELGFIHIVWIDNTVGVWGNDIEIMYTRLENIDTIEPVLDHPNDVVYEEGMVGNSINWTAIDLNPLNYTIFLDTNPIHNGTWISGIPINVSIDGLSAGSYTYTLEVADISGNNATDSVNVLVTPPAIPSLSNPNNIEFEQGISGYNISWIATDISPYNYTITRDGIFVENGTWTSNSPIEIEIDGLPADSYTYIIIVEDLLGNNNTDSVDVLIWPAADPVLNLPLTIGYTEGETGNNISWYAIDLTPGTYTITRNGSSVDSGTWISNTEYNTNIDGLESGIYLYTITVSDQLGRTDTGSVLVTVSPTSNGDNKIPFGNSWILFSSITIIGLIISIKKRKL